jgi:regulator of cell morphogenesis and NO signaling
MSNDPTLAEIVTSQPAAARILERHQLDYCCGGQQRLRTACDAADVDPDDVLAELATLTPQPDPDWATMTPTLLVDHLEATHHAYLHSEFPRLSALVQKVVGVHGSRHPELANVLAAYEELRADLEPHLTKEERVLFPMIRELARSTTAPDFPCGSLQNPIRVMLTEHDRAGEVLARLRELTADYTTPADGCASYHALYEGLQGLETDTHLHIHKENNVLFPAVVVLEQRFATGSAAS